jgi:hypothetical protein
VNQVSNDDVYQVPKVISGDKNIHLLSGSVKENVGDLPLNMCFTLQNNNYNSIPKCIMGCSTFTFARAPQKMGT